MIQMIRLNCFWFINVILKGLVAVLDLDKVLFRNAQDIMVHPVGFFHFLMDYCYG